MTAGARWLLPARAAFVAVLARCWLPTAVALAAAAVAMRAGAPPSGAGAGASGPLLLWLHLPCLALTAFAAVSTLEAWPLFGRDRDGRAVLRRLTRTVLDGCGMAAVGGAAATALALALTGAAFGLIAQCLSDVEAPRAFSRAAGAPGAVTLDAASERMVLQAPGVLADALRVNPLALFRPDHSLAPAELEITIDGELLAAKCVVSGNGEQVLVPLPSPRAVREITIARTATASLALLFPRGSVEVRGVGSRSLVTNLALGAACYGIPTVLALLATCALRTVLGWAALVTVALAVIAILALGELTPSGHALTACARGRFLASEVLPWRSSAVLGGALAAAALLPSTARSFGRARTGVRLPTSGAGAMQGRWS